MPKVLMVGVKNPSRFLNVRRSDPNYPGIVGQVKKSKGFDGIAEIESILQNLGIAYSREVRFHEKRKWRFDFVLSHQNKTAIEYEGGTWMGGRHNTGAGFEKDCEKYNTAALMGWKVFRFTSGMVKRGEVEILLGKIAG